MGSIQSGRGSHESDAPEARRRRARLRSHRHGGRQDAVGHGGKRALAYLVGCGAESALADHPAAKPIGAIDEGLDLLRAARLDGVRLADDAAAVESLGVVSVAGSESATDRVKGAVGLDEKSGLGGFVARFLESLAQHRHWGREQAESVPA